MGKQDSKQRPVLERWLEVDLSLAAREGRLRAAYEVELPIARATETLAAGRGPILVGEPGVGKTAVVHELVRRALVDASSPLAGKRVLQLSIRRCASTLGKDDAMGSVMLQLLEALRARPDVVPYFRDFSMAWRFDLEPYFEALGYERDVPPICEGETASVAAILEYEPDLERHYTPVVVAEPDLERTRRILAGWAKEAGGAQAIDDAALETALQLAHRFLPRTRLPRKCIEPLRKLVEVHGAGDAPGASPVSPGRVIEHFCRNFGIPRVLVDATVAFDLDDFRTRLSESVLGQDEAVSAMLNMVSRIKAGLIDPRRPFGVFLFVGPTGVGKTHIARSLARELLGSGDKMIRLNMADYPDDRHAAVVFGDPEGGSGALQRGVLTRRIVGQPVAVLLLDEFEKASSKLHDRFLQLFDEGAFINGAGETVSCRSLIIVATSNAGAELWRDGALGFGPAGGGERERREALARELDGRLRDHFRFEFLNRFDQIVHFRPLSREDIRTLAARELRLIEERAGIRLRGIELEVDDAVYDWLTVHGYDPFFGARFLNRTIERNVSSALADLLLRESEAGAEPARRIGLSVRKNAIHARWADEPAVPPRRREVELVEGTRTRVRSLPADDLGAVAAELAATASERLEEAESWRAEYSELLERMNEPAFWDEAGRGHTSMERFRELDVAIRAQARLARPLQRLVDALHEAPEGVADQPGIAQLVGDASAALREWDALGVGESAPPVWVVLRTTDPRVPPGGWVAELAEMELRWCRRLHLETTLVGYSLLDGDVSGVALEVTGPGALRQLDMERGLHRLVRKERRDLRIRIDVFPQADPPGDDARATRPARRVPARLELTPTLVGKLRVPELGIAEDWFGRDEPLLVHFLEDYAAILRERMSDASETARVYADAGVGARDPRTQAAVPRYKDALRGQLDRLLHAWQRIQA